MKRRSAIAAVTATMIVELSLMAPFPVAQAGSDRTRLTFPDHFPVNRGTIYTYRDTDSDRITFTYQVEVGAPVRVRGIAVPVVPFRGRTPELNLGAVEYFTSDSKNGFLNYGSDGPECSFRLSPPGRVPHGLMKGQTYTQVTRSLASRNIADDELACVPSTSTAAVTFEGLEAVKVPAGTFSCARLVIQEKTVDDEGEEDEARMIWFFAPGVGLVKGVIDDPEGGITELVSVTQ